MGEPVKASDTITRIAEYQCVIERHRYRGTKYDRENAEYTVDTRNEVFTLPMQTPVTIQVAANESSIRTEARFERAADIELFGMEVRKETRGSCCFARFLPTAEEMLNARTATSTMKVTEKVVEDKCDKEWATRSVCNK